MISIAKTLVLTVFALCFAPLTLRSYCTNPVSHVTMSGWWSVVGKGLLSMARGHVLITHWDIGPDWERTHPEVWVILWNQGGKILSFIWVQRTEENWEIRIKSIEKNWASLWLWNTGRTFFEFHEMDIEDFSDGYCVDYLSVDGEKFCGRSNVSPCYSFLTVCFSQIRW